MVLRRLIGIATMLGALCAAASSAWCETMVPLDLQVELLRKVVRFERGFVERAGGQVTILLVVRGGDPNSERAGAQLARAFENAKEIAGKPIKVVRQGWSSAASLKKAVAAANAQLVYLTPGFEAEAGNIAGALAGVAAITVSTDGEQVDHGIVLGFELVSARPKIALNLGQAKKQSLD